MIAAMRRSIAPALLLFASTALAAVEEPQVVLPNGGVRGQALPGGGAVFRGLPYAQPPVGALRWREPQPVAPWKGVRDALASGPPCAQSSAGWNALEAAASREDCLYLDVWTPEWPARAKRPVMVWLHGGGNTGGAGGSDPLYDGTRLVARGVVLVIVDYRLGVFGFFAHPQLTRESPHHASGNYGLLDQLAALRWVHDNIAALGGDPAQVTLFGQSAGAMDLSTLMASPLARGLFHRAIAESGSVLRDLPSLADHEQAGSGLAASLKAPAVGALAHLRRLPVDVLLKAARGATPNLDGWLLPRQPAEVFAEGAASPVPLIVGSNAIEFQGSASPDELRREIERQLGSLAPRALVLYGLADGATAPADPLYGTAGDQWSADTQFRCPAVVQGRWHAAAGHPTWQYEFDRAIPPKPTVVHSSELPYVFDNLWDHGSQAGQYEDADRRLAGAMQAYWTNFAKTGDPNGPGLPEWPRYDGQSRRFLQLTRAGEIRDGRDQRGAFCDLFAESLVRTSSTP
jgi:para-nitrobenzyl esterase